MKTKAKKRDRRPSVTYAQLKTLVINFETIYPDAYGYTDTPTGIYLLFRNREESFDKTQAVVTIKYKDD